jgi:hypothetical protein
MLKDIPRQQVDFTGILVGDAVIDFIRKNSPVKAELDGRWQKVDNVQASPEWIQKFEEVRTNQ